ncbi:acyl-CoA dehydrogenase family protein [Myroides sp. LJL116]
MSILSQEEQSLLREQILLANNQGSLTKVQLDILFKHNLFNMFVPKQYNGLELDFIKALEIQESLAYIDGSLGWTTTLCSGANMFAGYLQPAVCEDIFSNPKVCFGGSGKVGGIAHKIGEEYIVNGQWNIVTGLEHSTIFTANCQIIQDGIVLKNPDGSDLYRSFYFFEDEITIHRNWDMIGLKATGSHGFSVKDVQVGENRVFSIVKQASFNTNAIYRFPFFSFARFTLAVNHLGMQQNFLDQAKKYFLELPSNPYLELHLSVVDTIESSVKQHREAFYSLARVIWDKVQNDISFTKEDIVKINTLCKDLVYEGRNSLNQVLPYLGLELCRRNSCLQLIYSDLITACQHSLFIREQC